MKIINYNLYIIFIFIFFKSFIKITFIICVIFNVPCSDHWCCLGLLLVLVWGFRCFCYLWHITAFLVVDGKIVLDLIVILPKNLSKFEVLDAHWFRLLSLNLLPSLKINFISSWNLFESLILFLFWHYIRFVYIFTTLVDIFN